MKKLSVLLGLLALQMFCASPLSAEVRLPAIIDSHMVLQQNQPIKIWGWADPGEQVSVELGGEVATAKTNEDGRWLVTLPAMKADGKSHTLKISGSNQLELTDLLIGEVWVGSGQSNMEWQLHNTHRGPEEIQQAHHPQIRLFHVPKVQAAEPAQDVVADWKVCTPESVPAFSAVLYYFGKKLHQDLQVPIGLINTSWGGSAIEPWTIANGKSGGMYNGMVAPLQPFAVRGVIWYQGETNAMQKNGLAYRDKMEHLITGWRDSWQQPLPFYYVQIAPWSGRYEEGELPKLWEAQAAAMKIPQTGMVTVTDLVDDISDIHPRNKKDVGERLALWALAKDYGKKDLVFSGPMFQSISREGEQLRVNFSYTAQGLKSRDGKPLTEFEIAGEDGKFITAEARIDGDAVIVSSPEIQAPQQVRFGWHKLANPNLMNSAGLPASPFQSENWQGAKQQQ